MYAPRIHFKEHMHTEKTRLQLQIWPQKRGQFLDLEFAPFPIEGWFWGPLIGLRNGPRNSAFFPPFALSFGAQYLVSMAAAATILCVPDRLRQQRVCLLKVSLHNHNHMRSTQLLRLQAHTHTVYIYIYIYLFIYLLDDATQTVKQLNNAYTWAIKVMSLMNIVGVPDKTMVVAEISIQVLFKPGKVRDHCSTEPGRQENNL